MVTFTLDFTSSYRGITDADLNPILGRDIFGFNGIGIPISEVTFTGSLNDHTIPAYNLFDGTDQFLLDHSPTETSIDYVSDLGLRPYLRFPVAVVGPPIWENYVQDIYTGDNGEAEYADDVSVFYQAYQEWLINITVQPFEASTATYSDNGGLLGQYTSDIPTLIDYFVGPTSFPCEIDGSEFNDNFSAGQYDCTLRGWSGDDTLNGQNGADRIYGGKGADRLLGGVGNDFMSGDQGNDTVFGDLGLDKISGRDGDDVINGGQSNDELYGAAGADSLYGDDGDDTLTGGVGDDFFNGGTGNDSMYGGADNDVLNGGAGADTMIANDGSDVLYGGSSGNDSLVGGSGNDFLHGGLGKDTLIGNADADTFTFAHLGAANADRIVDFVQGADKIALARAAFAGVRAAVNAQEFRLGTAAVDGDDRILYDSATGRLYYDSDGTLNGASSAPPVLFAIVANHAALTHLDFLVV